MIGIYKITSPSGKIYIGQSVNIKRRLNVYKNLNCEQQPFLYRSLKKYGYENHTVEILIECEKSELDKWEVFYIEKFDSFNSKNGLNLKSGGHCGGGCSEITKQKLRKPKSKETREKLRLSAIGRKVSKETREKHRQNMLGNTNLKGYQTFLGRNHTEETKNKIREKRKLQVMPKGYKRPKFSEEWKNNMSKSSNPYKGLDHKNSRVVIHLETGIFYSLSELKLILDVKKIGARDLKSTKGKYANYQVL